MQTEQLFSTEVFGERLRSCRRARDLNQQDLAKQMHIAQGWISELENGKQTRLEAETVFRFSLALNVSADYPYNVTWLMASHILLCLMLWLPTAYARPGVRSCRGAPHSAPSVPCDPSPSPCCRPGPGNGQEQQHGEVF